MSGDGEVVGGQRAVSTSHWLCCFLQPNCIDQSLALLCSAAKMCHRVGGGFVVFCSQHVFDQSANLAMFYSSDV